MKNLKLYIHIPFCVKKCAYCDFLSFPCEEKTQIAYADALIREIRFYGAKMKEYAVSTIFIGGGTPTWLDENKMTEILETVYRCFFILPDAEITIECNPNTLTAEKLKKYKNIGINRLSIGLQSTDNEELKILGRMHSYETFVKSYELAKNIGFDNINVDLISGIPYQTAEKFLSSLQKVVRLKPTHISVYSLIVEEGTPFYKMYHEDVKRQEAGVQTSVLPSEDEVYRTTKLTQTFLKNAGYKQYEISNFALSGFACRHNLGYWMRENYLGLGLGAASLIKNVRYSNLTDLYDYIEQSKKIEWHSCENRMETSKIEEHTLATNLHASVEVLSRQAQMEEFMFLGLRMQEGVTRTDFKRCFGVPIESVYKQALDHLKKEGLLELSAGTIRLTEKGQDVSNYALAQFLL